MRQPVITIISSIGAQTYQDKYHQSPNSWEEFWDCSLKQNEIPIDVVDYYNLNNDLKIKIESNRHLFINGIIIANRFKEKYRNVNLINVYDDQKDSHIEMIEKSDFVLISTSLVFGQWVNKLCKIIESIKLRNLNTKVIIGGFGVYRLFNGDTNHKGKIDKLVHNGADTIIISRNGIEKVFDLIKRKDEILSKIVEENSNWEQQPGDYNLSYYSEYNNIKHTVVLTSHGCPFNCSFCTYRYFLGPVRYEPIVMVKKIMNRLFEDERLKYIRIADECFNIPEERAIEICKHFIKSNYKIPWCCFLKGDAISLKLVRYLKKSGCTMVSIGLESGSSKMQKIYNKNLRLEKVQKAIGLLQDEGIFVNVSLLVGYYGENWETVNQTKEFLLKSKPDLARINIWSPKPNERESKLGKLFNFNITKDGWGHNSLTETKACNFAVDLFSSRLGVDFLPPFSSIFDQWPELIGKELSNIECRKFFHNYYESALNMKNLLKRKGKLDEQ